MFELAFEFAFYFDIRFDAVCDVKPVFVIGVGVVFDFVADVVFYFYCVFDVDVDVFVGFAYAFNCCVRFRF